MKRHRLLIIILAICIAGAVLIAKQLLKRNEARFIDYASEAVWSKDGKALYYTRLNQWNRLYRYDTATGKKRCFNLKVPYGFDISPDEKSIVGVESHIVEDSGKTDYLVKTDLSTGKGKRFYAIKRRLGPHVCWLPQNKILFYEQTTPYKENQVSQSLATYSVDPNGALKSLVASGIAPEVCASDGTGFIHSRYINGNLYYYYYSISAHADTKLIPKRRAVVIQTSSASLVYVKFNPPANPIVELHNIKTGRTFALANNMTIMGDSFISPDSRYYWTSKTKVGVQNPCSLYLLRTPDIVYKRLIKL